MSLRKSVLTWAVELVRLVLALINSDSLLACTAVAGSSISENRIISRDDAVCNERINDRIETARIASRNSNSV